MPIGSVIIMTRDSVHTIKISGDAGLRAAQELADQLSKAIASHDDIVVATDAISTADITTIQLLLAASKQAQAAGKSLRLAATGRRAAGPSDPDRLPRCDRPRPDARWRVLDTQFITSQGQGSMTKTILTIDDSASIRQMVSMTLTSAGLEVIEAINGADGYDKAIANTVHAVITDLNMPVMNGIEFVRKYRQHPSSKGVPIILLTTESDDELKRQAKEAGATGWIVKPFKQDQLLSVIKKVTGA